MNNDAFKGMNNLSSLFLQYNQITQIKDNAFRDMSPLLKKLDLSYNVKLNAKNSYDAFLSLCLMHSIVLNATNFTKAEIVNITEIAMGNCDRPDNSFVESFSCNNI